MRRFSRVICCTSPAVIFRTLLVFGTVLLFLAVVGVKVPALVADHGAADLTLIDACVTAFASAVVAAE
jgi:hypothetical protein